MTTEVPGLDVAGLTAWLAAAHPDLAGAPLSAAVIAGRSQQPHLRGRRRARCPSSCAGRRSVTCSRARTTCAASIASSPPSRASAVPVPPPIDVVDDTAASAVTGTVFFVMERAPGRVLAHREQNARLYAPRTARPQHRARPAPRRPARRRSGSGRPRRLRPPRRLPRAAAVDVAAAARRVAVARDAEPRCAAGVASRRECPRPSAPESCTATTASTTPSSSATGDEPHISAILDWEMATLGDPLVDLGIFALYWDIAAPARRVRGRRAERRRSGRRVPGLRRARRGLRGPRRHRHPGSALVSRVRGLQARRDPRGDPLPLPGRRHRRRRLRSDGRARRAARPEGTARCADGLRHRRPRPRPHRSRARIPRRARASRRARARRAARRRARPMGRLADRRRPAAEGARARGSGTSSSPARRARGSPTCSTRRSPRSRAGARAWRRPRSTAPPPTPATWRC